MIETITIYNEEFVINTEDFNKEIFESGKEDDFKNLHKALIKFSVLAAKAEAQHAEVEGKISEMQRIAMKSFLEIKEGGKPIPITKAEALSKAEPQVLRMKDALPGAVKAMELTKNILASLKLTVQLLQSYHKDANAALSMS